jgi:hypothetical protein
VWGCLTAHTCKGSILSLMALAASPHSDCTDSRHFTVLSSM